MKCNESHKKLIFLDERTLTVTEENDILLHLENCNECKKRYKLIKEIGLLINEEKTTEINPYFYSTVKSKLESSEVQHYTKYKPVWQRIASGSILIVIIFAAILSGLVLGRNETKYETSKQTIGQSFDGLHNDHISFDKQLTTNFFRY